MPHSPSPDFLELEVVASILEDLGSEVNVIFPVDAAPVRTDDVRAAQDGQDETKLIAGDDRVVFTARVDPRTSARQGAKRATRGRSVAVPLLRSRDGALARASRAAGGASVAGPAPSSCGIASVYGRHGSP